MVGGRWLPHTKEVANSGSPRVKEVADGGGSLERRRCSTADLPGRARWPAVDPSGRRRLPAGDAPPPDVYGGRPMGEASSDWWERRGPDTVQRVAGQPERRERGRDVGRALGRGQRRD